MMVSPEQHAEIERLLNASLILPGDVVEAGCNAGSTSRLLAEWLIGTGRALHLYDSFEGLPPESGYAGLMTASRATVESAIVEQCRTESLPDHVQIHEGWFSQTMPQSLPDQICFAFIDCDLYQSMLDAIRPILPRLTGVMVLHDFTHERWGEGVRRAVAELGLIVTETADMAVAWKADQC